MAYPSSTLNPDMFGYVAPATPAVRQSRTTNDPLSRCNQSTSAGRRTVDLYRCFMRDMGNPSSTTAQANALAAAELSVCAEDARQRLLAGSGNADEVVRIENLVRRAVRRLGIAPQRTATGPDLKAYLAEREQAERGG